MEPLDWALLPFKRYFDFSGRSSRAEYWYFTALMWFVNLLVLLGGMMLGEAVEGVLEFISGIFGLVTFIPSIAVTVRRLHDINRSGFVLCNYSLALAAILIAMLAAVYLWYFAAGVLLLALIVVCLKFLILMVSEGDPGPNLYGPNPYGLTYGY